jgi:excisionase family DNA binding protein
MLDFHFPEVMTIETAARYLCISPDTLYNYAARGIVPAFRLGNRWRFKKSQLDAWMDEKAEAGQKAGRGY